MQTVKKPTVLMERFPYRYVESGVLENGQPDYRIQKMNSFTKRYKDMYLCDNQMQILTAMEDHDYTVWLDPDGGACYVNDVSKNYFQSRTDSNSTGRDGL